MTINIRHDEAEHVFARHRIDDTQRRAGNRFPSLVERAEEASHRLAVDPGREPVDSSGYGRDIRDARLCVAIELNRLITKNVLSIRDYRIARFIVCRDATTGIALNRPAIANLITSAFSVGALSWLVAASLDHGFEPIPGGYRVIDANGLALVHVYGEPPPAVAISPNRLTSDEARSISKLIARLPELVELERDRNRAGSRRKPQPIVFRPVTIGDLIREGKLLEVHCGNCRPERHLYLNPEILRLPKRRPGPEVARHLVCSKCGARNGETYNPIWARPDARVGGRGHYPDFVGKKPS